MSSRRSGWRAKPGSRSSRMLSLAWMPARALGLVIPSRPPRRFSRKGPVTEGITEPGQVALLPRRQPCSACAMVFPLMIEMEGGRRMTR